MKRIISLIAIIIFIGCTQSSENQDHNMLDDRLLGKWQSDTEKTFKWLREARNYDETRLKKLEKIYGKLVLEITTDEIVAKYDDNTDVSPLEIIGIESDTIAIVSKDPLTNEREIRLILIEDDYTFSIYQDDFDIREYFRKID